MPHGNTMPALLKLINRHVQFPQIPYVNFKPVSLFLAERPIGSVAHYRSYSCYLLSMFLNDHDVALRVSALVW